MSQPKMDRRSFLTVGLGGITCLSLPSPPTVPWDRKGAESTAQVDGITSVRREETLFAGIRRPIHSRDELVPRIERLQSALGDRIAGPLTHIFRYDTPVEGYDSEIGYPVQEVVNAGEIRTHTLRAMRFFSTLHEGPVATVPQTRARLYEYMDRVGLSPELEVVEVFHRYDAADPDHQRVEIMASYLPWPEKYREELVRVLGEDTARVVWEGGEAMTPHTLVDERARWVAASLLRLKAHSTPEQQFDILSRVALERPPEDVARYKEIYEAAGGDITAVLEAHQAHFLRSGRVRGWFDPPTFDGKVLHASKVPYDEAAYMAATTPEEVRKAYCFCALVREAKDPVIDPIFCFRAAGWDRQFFEPIMGVQFKRCQITHSILKGDRFCAWDYHLT
jgi:effector-binding domain-containing protein